MNEIVHKIGIAVKKNCQVTISPLLQHMLGFKRAIFPHGDHVADYKIKIKEMALYVRKVQLSSAIRMGHVTALEKTSCKYPIRRVEVKVDTVPTGNMNYVQDNAFGTAAKETRHCLCRQRCSERHYWGKFVRFQTLQNQLCGTQR